MAKVKSHYWLAHRLGLDGEQSRLQAPLTATQYIRAHRLILAAAPAAFGLQCATYILRNIERLSPEDTEGLGALLRVLKTARVILPG